jgi:hypothetical protein
MNWGGGDSFAPKLTPVLGPTHNSVSVHISIIITSYLFNAAQ